MDQNDKQVIMIVGLIALACYGAYCQKWEFVGGIVTGIFALLNLEVRHDYNIPN